MSKEDIERELERTMQLKGFRHGIHDFLGYVQGAEALKKHNDHSGEHYLKQSLLDKKTKELLMIIGIVAGRGLISHIQIHMHAAHKAGASPEEILEALNLMRSNLGALTSMAGLEAWRATFRPDIPTIDRIVGLG